MVIYMMKNGIFFNENHVEWSEFKASESQFHVRAYQKLEWIQKRGKLVVSQDWEMDIFFVMLFRKSND